MARAELDYAKPDVLVHFTGRMHWIAKHLYKSNPQSKSSDVGFDAIDGAGPTTGFMSAPILGSAVSIFTGHPNGGRTREAKLRVTEDRKTVLKWAVSKISERLNQELPVL